MRTKAPGRGDLVLSGGFATSSNSARAGFLPVCLERVPLAALKDIDVYLRTGDGGAESFTLFSGPYVKLDEGHRQRLLEGGVKFIFIPMNSQGRFREQTEAILLELAGDPNVAISVRAELVYETSVELVDELLREPDLMAKSPRLETVSRAVAMLVLNDEAAFSHLFAASHHDFYTAAHMVNVATWMVPLAYALGHRDMDELSRICQAGLLHDIGKTYISADLLNKHGELTASEWKQMQKHPQLGYEHLARCGGVDPVIMTVALQHHERMDGGGYPRGIKGDKIDPISRICAVVDSFDAMTAFRPFKRRTTSAADAMDIILGETPRKYDAQVVEAWTQLVAKAASIAAPPLISTPADTTRRTAERFKINCPGQLAVMWQKSGMWKESAAVEVVVHSISRTGVGMLCPRAVVPGEYVRVRIHGAGTLNKADEGVVVRCREYADGWFEIGMKHGTLSSMAA